MNDAYPGGTPAEALFVSNSVARWAFARAGFGPPGEAGVAGGGVEAGETTHVGRGRRLEELLGPGERLEELHREPHQPGVRSDVGRDLQVAV